MRTRIRTAATWVGTALLLAGCTSPAAVHVAPSPTGDTHEPVISVPSAQPDEGDAAAVAARAATVAERAESELGPDVLPTGYYFVDAVDVDGSGLVSHVYGGPQGPTGPTLFIHTGPSPASSRQDGLPRESVTGLSTDFAVTIQRDVEDGVSWTFVTVALPGVGTIRVIGKGVPEGDLLQMTERLIAV